MDLFTKNAGARAPLADRMRPRKLDEFIGQEHIVGKGRLLRRAIEADKLSSCIFFGPSGTGKTTLAEVIAHMTGSRFEKVSAVTSGVKEVRAIIDKARLELSAYGRSTYLMLDECHRWTKAQMDSILPHVESGVVKFIGTTTENPMVAMTPAIVSRCRIFQFLPLTVEEVERAMDAAAADAERGFGAMRVELEPEAKRHIAFVANGDVRSALNALELAVLTTPPSEDGVIRVDISIAEESIQRRAIRCDDEEYYNMLPAFCQSLRGSDSDGALFWAARLLYAGIDPRIIARRVIAHASEDVGMANPTAMLMAVAAAQALEFNGMPEANLSLSQAIIYVCESPKSNSVVTAMCAAADAAENTSQIPVPAHLRDTHYSGAERLGNGIGYKYAHDFPGHYVRQQYLPDTLVGQRFYQPSDMGYEKKIREALEKRRGEQDS